MHFGLHHILSEGDRVIPPNTPSDSEWWHPWWCWCWDWLEPEMTKINNIQVYNTFLRINFHQWPEFFVCSSDKWYVGLFRMCLNWLVSFWVTDLSGSQVNWWKEKYFTIWTHLIQKYKVFILYLFNFLHGFGSLPTLREQSFKNSTANAQHTQRAHPFEGFGPELQ